MLKETKIRLSI